jgi:hypothetical protein
MPTTFDGENLLIILPAATDTIDVEADLYSEWKDWQLASGPSGSSNRRYPQAFSPDGGNPLTPGITQGRYSFLRNDLGWRIRPAEEDATVNFNGNLVPTDPSIPMTVPTLGAFTVLLNGLQPITQSVDSLLLAQQEASYNGEVWVDTVGGGSPGTAYPLGTASDPVDNLADAFIIAAGIGSGITHLVIKGSITLTQAIPYWSITGEGGGATVALNGQDVSGVIFTGCGLSGTCGTLTAPIVIRDGAVLAAGVTGFFGSISQSVFQGDLTILPNTHTGILACASDIAGTNRPEIKTTDSTGITLSIRDWNGGLTLQTFTSGAPMVSVDMSSGTLELGIGVLTGTYVVRGISELLDNSGAGATVIRDGLIDPNDIAGLTYGGAIHIDSINGDDNSIGTHEFPVRTAGAAKTRADLLGLTEYHVKGGINLLSAHDRWSFRGDSASFNDTVNFNGQSVDESRFEGLELAGTAAPSAIEAVFCQLDDPGGIYGIFRQCGLMNRFKIENGTTPEHYVFHHTFSQVAGAAGTVYAPIDQYQEAFGPGSVEVMASWDLLALGQSFTGNGRGVTRARFWMATEDTTGGNMTGTLQAHIYAHSGTFGTSSVPTGAPLASSTTVMDPNDLPVNEGGGGPGPSWQDFLFDGTFVPVLGTNYVVVLEYTGHNGAFDHWVEVGRAANATAEHPGNFARSSGSWSAQATQDLLFKVEFSASVEGRPELDFTNSALDHEVHFRNYIGGISVANMTQGMLSIDTPAGTVDIKDTVVGGDIVVRGEGLLVKNAGPGALVTDGFQDAGDFHVMRQLLAGKINVSLDDQTITVYDTDDITVIAVLGMSVDGRNRTRIS